MRYSLEESVGPTTEPVTLDEARLHLKLGDDDTTDEDALILALIKTARGWVENYCRRSFIGRTYVMRLDGFPVEIKLPRGPVRAVSSVKYYDFGGTLSTMSSSSYQTDIYSLPARVCLVHGATWPQVQVGKINAVEVTYTAGPALLNQVPKEAKQAILLILAHLFQNRELASAEQMYEIPFAVKTLLAPLEIRDFTLE